MKKGLIEMLEKDCYFHAIISDSNGTLKIFDNIVKTGKILSIQKSHFEFDNLRMNKIEEICICKKGRVGFFYNSAYDMFVRRNVSFIIKGDLPNVYKPELISVRDTFRERDRFVNLGMTDLPDEYRVKDEILLDDVVGINLPVKSILSNNSLFKFFSLGSGKDVDNDSGKRFNLEDRVKWVTSFYEEMIRIMEENDVRKPIYDIEGKMEIRSSDDIVKQKKK